jgi:hypothetical protein
LLAPGEIARVLGRPVRYHDAPLKLFLKVVKSMGTRTNKRFPARRPDVLLHRLAPSPASHGSAVGRLPERVRNAGRGDGSVMPTL